MGASLLSTPFHCSKLKLRAVQPALHFPRACPLAGGHGHVARGIWASGARRLRSRYTFSICSHPSAMWVQRTTAWDVRTSVPEPPCGSKGCPLRAPALLKEEGTPFHSVWEFAHFRVNFYSNQNYFNISSFEDDNTAQRLRISMVAPWMDQFLAMCCWENDI